MRMSLVPGKPETPRDGGGAPDGQFSKDDDDPFAEDKENVPVKARRSGLLSTSPRKGTGSVLWGKEPMAQMARQSLSPIKRQPVCDDIGDEDAAVVVMEEVEEEAEEESAEGKPDLARQPDRANPADAVEEAIRPTTPPPFASQPTIAVERLTKSSSPKKPRRRSSFFGRASAFAGLNLGFYAEERREAAEQEAVERGTSVALLSPPASPTKLHREPIPQPRLDVHGMPRLPRSMSSPSGLLHDSPGKRRAVSLRTATLIKSGQQTFEQQKLLSPPPSPTKAVASSSFSILCTSPELSSADAAQIALPESEDEDEDEVDKSLSSLMDGDDDEQSDVAPSIPLAIASGARRSLGDAAVGHSNRSSAAGRASLPVTLHGVALDESASATAVGQWREAWREEKEQGEADQRGTSIDVGLSDADCDAHDDGAIYAAEHGSQIDDHRTANKKGSEEAEQSYTMLRHMVRASPRLTALLDEVAKVQVCAADQGENNEDVSFFALASPAAEAETGKEQTIAVPQALRTPQHKPSRRASEQPQRRPHRRSAVAGPSVLSKDKSRKSEGGAPASTVMDLAHAAEEAREVHRRVGSTPTTKAAETALAESCEEEPIEVTPLVTGRICDDETRGEHMGGDSPAGDAEEAVAPPRRSPRKRTAEAIQTQIPKTATQSHRTVKASAVAAVDNSKDGSANSGSSTRGTTRTRKARKEASSSDDRQGSQLIMEPSSPIKRTRRAAKDAAEGKIKAALGKRVTTTARAHVSEAGKDKGRAKAALTAAADGATPSSRISRHAAIQSEPGRTTRSGGVRRP